MPTVGIIDYAMGNLQSVTNAFEYLGAKVLVLGSPKGFDQVSHLILPGVGAFSTGMDHLGRQGFVEPLQQAADSANIPILGICLGMQLLANEGTEGQSCQGLGLIPGRVLKLDVEPLRVPHVGWNQIHPTQDNPLFPRSQSNDFYFVHSYYFQSESANDILATCHYGIDFPCVVRRQNIFGMQFHPEKSHGYGLELLHRFLQITC